MTKPNSHVKFWSTKKHKKILTGISWKRYLRGEGMNDYWKHEPKFFWYKKKVRKSQEFFDSELRPPPLESIFWKNSWRNFFYGPFHFIFSEIKKTWKPENGDFPILRNMLKMFGQVYLDFESSTKAKECKSKQKAQKGGESDRRISLPTPKL